MTDNILLYESNELRVNEVILNEISIIFFATQCSNAFLFQQIEIDPPL